MATRGSGGGAPSSSGPGPGARRRPGRAGRALGVAVALGAPWTWFAARDAGALLDLVATGLPAVAAAVAVAALAVAVVVRRAAPVALALAASVLAAGAAAVGGPWRPTPTPAPAPALRVVAANALHRNPAVAGAAADLLAQGGDVVVVVEGALAVHDQLRDDFAFAALGPQAEHAVLSRYPVRLLPPPADLPADRRVSRWEVAAPAGPVILYAVHLRRPQARRTDALREALRGQREDVRRLVRSAAGEGLPVIVAGDLNVSDRASGYRLLAGPMRDAMRSGWAGPTYLRPRYRPFLLRIDHLFVPRDWCAAGSRRFRVQGSDHRGVAADVGPCPGERGD